MDDAFPRETFEELGYNCAVHGQKTYNGVAILSKSPIEDVTPRLPGGDGDDHARYLEAIVKGKNGIVRVASIYAPNGNPIGTDKFKYKLGWLERLKVHARELLALEEPVALMGDYNVIPTVDDVHDPKAWLAMLCSSRNRARPCAGLKTSAIPMRSAPAMRKRINIRSGIIRPVPGRRTMASASTTFCSHRRQRID